MQTIIDDTDISLIVDLVDSMFDLIFYKSDSYGPLYNIYILLHTLHGPINGTRYPNVTMQ